MRLAVWTGIGGKLARLGTHIRRVELDVLRTCALAADWTDIHLQAQRSVGRGQRRVIRPTHGHAQAGLTERRRVVTRVDRQRPEFQVSDLDLR